VLELDDSKATQGLAEVYQAEYVRAAAEAGGASGAGAGLPDKQEPLRRELRALWGALAAKLDALSAFHYTPKPLVEELEVRGAGDRGWGWRKKFLGGVSRGFGGGLGGRWGSTGLLLLRRGCSARGGVLPPPSASTIQPQLSRLAKRCTQYRPNHPPPYPTLT
jgi:hypothetical protein